MSNWTERNWFQPESLHTTDESTALLSNMSPDTEGSGQSISSQDIYLLEGLKRTKCSFLVSLKFILNDLFKLRLSSQFFFALLQPMTQFYWNLKE